MDKSKNLADLNICHGDVVTSLFSRFARLRSALVRIKVCVFFRLLLSISTAHRNQNLERNCGMSTDDIQNTVVTLACQLCARRRRMKPGRWRAAQRHVIMKISTILLQHHNSTATRLRLLVVTRIMTVWDGGRRRRQITMWKPRLEWNGCKASFCYTYICIYTAQSHGNTWHYHLI